jgi:hypothetical protein
MDQTGVHLVPASNWTYDTVGSTSVAVVGAEDKRQITACISSSLAGDLLPLQLIFQGKTARSLPPRTPQAIASRIHLTFSENHWSSLETMKQFVNEIIMPHADRCIELHRLNTDAHILLVLDVWAVHKSEEFRRFLRTQHPRIHLVFIPANCTGKLQVADVVLQRPFKSVVKASFNRWAGEQIAEQIADGKVVGLSEMLKMSSIKPLALQWCIDSWRGLQERKALILSGWKKCCTSLYDVHDREKRIDALSMAVDQKLDLTHIPEEEEQDEDAESDHEEDSSEDELDITKPRAFGIQGKRLRAPSKQFGYQIASSAITMTDDSD